MNFCIWKVSETDESTLRAAFEYADAQRKSQILRLRTVADQKQRLCADALARSMLSAQCGLSPAELQFSRTELGKPFLSNCDLQFNLSHSGDFVLCATEISCIGVDIEAFRPISTALIRRVCTQEEQQYIANDEKRFFQIWTAKEALLKYRGTGIREDLRNLCVYHNGKLSFEGLKFHSELHESYAFTIVYE